MIPRCVWSPERKRPPGNGALSNYQGINNLGERTDNIAPRPMQRWRAWAREI
jgi:hypothetical protein